MDSYQFGQEDEGDNPGEDGHMPWNDRAGPSPAASDAEHEPPSGPAGHIGDDQAREIKRVDDRMLALAAAEEAAGSEAPIREAIARARAQILKESSGRTQQDAAVAHAVRRQTQLARDLDAQELARVEERRRANEAK